MGMYPVGGANLCTIGWVHSGNCSIWHLSVSLFTLARLDPWAFELDWFTWIDLTNLVVIEIKVRPLEKAPYTR